MEDLKAGIAIRQLELESVSWNYNLPTGIRKSKLELYLTAGIMISQLELHSRSAAEVRNSKFRGGVKIGWQQL